MVERKIENDLVKFISEFRLGDPCERGLQSAEDEINDQQLSESVKRENYEKSRNVKLELVGVKTNLRLRDGEYVITQTSSYKIVPYNY